MINLIIALTFSVIVIAICEWRLLKADKRYKDLLDSYTAVFQGYQALMETLEDIDDAFNNVCDDETNEKIDLEFLRIREEKERGKFEVKLGAENER